MLSSLHADDLLSVLRFVLGKFAPICFLQRHPRLGNDDPAGRARRSRKRDEDVEVVLRLPCFFAHFLEFLQNVYIGGGCRKLAQRVENRHRSQVCKRAPA